MTLFDFPKELLFIAVAHLPPKDLIRLMRTCRTFQARLTPILRSHITENATTILFTGISLRSLPIVNLALVHGGAWHTANIGNGGCVNGLLLAVEEGNIPIMSALLAHFGSGIAADTDASQYRNFGGGRENQQEEDDGDEWDDDEKRCHPTPLDTAVELDNVPMAKFLLENGAWSNAKWPGNWSDPDVVALESVASDGSVEMAELLLGHGARLESPDLLWTACESENWPVVELFLREGISIPSEMRWWNGHRTGKRTAREAREFVRMAKKQDSLEKPGSESD